MAFLLSDLAVCSITGLKSTTLLSTSLINSSGKNKKMHSGKTLINTGHTANRENVLPCPSPQLRMSFIVFSTEGRILMSLTEDRWVQIPLERLVVPLFSIMQQFLSSPSCSRIGHSSLTVLIHNVFPKKLYFQWILSSLRSFYISSHLRLCGQFMCLIFPQPTFFFVTKSFHRSPPTLRYLLLQKTHFLSH